MRIAGIALLAALALGLAACDGSDSDETSTNPPPPPAETDTGETDTGEASDDGAEIYVSAGCGGCHTFEAAGSTASIGPNLDNTTLSVEEIEVQIRDGSGAMPSFGELLSDEEIQALAQYVAASQ